jgi:hypothetical protein
VGLALSFGEKQLLALIDAQEQRRRSGFVAIIRRSRHRFVGELLEERLELCRAKLDAPAQVGARYRNPGGRKRLFERGKETGLASDSGALRTDDRQRQEVPVVAGKPRQQTCAQKGGLAGTGCAKDDQKPWLSTFTQAPQTIERLHDRSFAAEKNTSILGFKRAQAAVGRPFRIIFRRPREVLGVETSFLQPVFESLQPFSRKGDMHLLVRDWENRAQHDVIAARGEMHDLPGSGEFLRQFIDGQILDQ